MLAAEFNTKYNKFLSHFSQLRLKRTNSVKWTMKGDDYLRESSLLFLYLRTLNRYIPGINLTDSDLDKIFSNALTLTSGFDFLEYELLVDGYIVNAIDRCGCRCAQNIVNITSNIVGGGENNDKLPFNTDLWILDNYQEQYYPLYGNNPKIQAYDNNGDVYAADYGTGPQLNYQDNDPTKALLSITWGYPIVTAGYVQISGTVNPSSSGGSGSGPALLVRTQSDLLEDGAGSGNWYLPIVLGANKRPYFVMAANQEVTTHYDKTFTPARLYGFANNDPQTIEISVQ